MTSESPLVEPNVTYRQIVVLSIINSGITDGKDLRNALAGLGLYKSLPGFYQLMGRMESAQLVVGTFRREDVNGYSIRHKSYSVTSVGLESLLVFGQFVESVKGLSKST